MTLTGNQLFFLIIITEIVFFAIAALVTNTIRYCALTKAYSKLRKHGFMLKMETLDNDIKEVLYNYEQSNK